MKTEVFTCDRCGKRMDKPKNFDCFYTTSTLNFESFEACVAMKDSSIAKIREDWQTIADESSVSLTLDVDTFFRSRLHHYELCNDCKKKLIKFLKGGNVC